MVRRTRSYAGGAVRGTSGMLLQPQLEIVTIGAGSVLFLNVLETPLLPADIVEKL